MIEKWQNLLNELEIVGSPGVISPLSQEEIEALELESKIILPIGYKEFGKVWGAGEIAEYMRIHFSRELLFEVSIDCIKSQLSYINTHSELEGDILDIESLNRLIDSALIFGDTGCAEVVFWDLRTYNKVDQSYDIYLANFDSFNGVYKIGRDFYEFIRGVCLGMDSYKVRSELIDTTTNTRGTYSYF